MNNFYEIVNDWDDKRLSATGEWRNDGYNCLFSSEAQALDRIYSHPDSKRLSVQKVKFIA